MNRREFMLKAIGLATATVVLPACQSVQTSLKKPNIIVILADDLGYERKFFPDRHGFDYWFGPIGGSVDYFHHKEYTGEPVLYENGELVERQGYMTNLITEEAVRFINRQNNKPFFLYVPYTAPHTPYQGPDDEEGELIAQDEYSKGTRETFAAMVECMDRGIGKIIKTLHDKGLTDNTIVIFASDNGANKKGRNAPFSGYKGGLFEGGIRVPCVIKWPDRIQPAAVSHQPCMTMDLSKSIVRIAGARIPANRPFDGIDIVRMVETNQPVRARNLFWRARRGERTRKAVRSANLKYIWQSDGSEIQEYLFDLETDQCEKNNLLKDRASDSQRLKSLLAAWERGVTHSR